MFTMSRPTQPILAYKSHQNINSNIYAERNSQKVTILHNNVNLGKHQDRPNVGTAPKTMDQH